ncbi:insulinase family protein [Candidatus Sulfidibacterium hydrothermale]|uniref:M16 family metallopeptidase n=1 Tax=Candidatus Sulfidibacterium hydrothermale TaxID=2875962 RepID=UPI001F0AD379|nr:pitrilysin family protein [Candidatus Sulfidibacterium hydrothermale]UBM62832.1 insulinase family protein [Candidatus Sulfidibacterium hydrothermale]
MSATIHPDRTQMPAPARFEELRIPQPEKIMLDNGLEVFVIAGDGVEVTRMDLVFDAGTSFQKVKLQAAAVNDLMGEGTKNHSSYEIAEILDFHGAYVDYFLTKDTAGLTLYSLTKYYDRLLPLVSEVVTEAVFPEEELAIFLDRRKQEFQVNSQKVHFLASQAFNQLIFGKNSSYGQVVEESDFDRLQRAHVLDFYKKFYQENRFFVVLSGKIDQQLIKRLSQIIGQLPFNKRVSAVSDTKTFVSSVSHHRELIEKEKALQSALRIGRMGIPRDHSDFPALNLLNTVLGGYFGSRLMRVVREEKGYTYGIYSAIQNYRHAGLFAVATEVNARYTADALREIKNQMEILCREKIGTDELQTVKNYVYGSYLRSFDGPLQLAERFKKSRELGVSFSSYKKTLDKMMRLSPDDLFEVAGKYLDPGQMKTLVVGDISQLQ